MEKDMLWTDVFFNCSVCIVHMIPRKGRLEEFFSGDNNIRILIERPKITKNNLLNTIMQ